LRTCEGLRQEGFTGRITLLGSEPEKPYDRPPLSKKMLAGEWDPELVRLRPDTEVAALELELRLGITATGLDTGRHVVQLAGGEELAYDGLVIATGASPRSLTGQPPLEGVATLRTLAESHALHGLLAGGTARLVVIGAGFIGLEVAATARQLGCAVTVLEGLPAPLMRGLGAEMGTAVAGVHGRNGVELRCGVRVAGLEGSPAGRVRGVRLDSGEVVPADVVLVGIGVAPNTGWLEGSGLELRDGVVCDEYLNAGAPGVFAAGDLVRWPNGAFAPDDDMEMRVEHWTNAAEQGAAAAANLLAWSRGEVLTPFTSVPFFWSDQFDSRIQFIGRAHGDDEVHVFTGSTDGKFAALYGHGGRLRGVLGVGSPRYVMPFRALLVARASWDTALAKAAELTGG
jgi:NADPH-dependent 2,4-dienoyl-CoA reductase/sulfur reductase-like enzyme